MAQPETTPPPPKIIYTKTDEAPCLSTYSLLPIVKAFTEAAGVDVQLADISLAGRILATFPENLTPEQRLPDALKELGQLAQTSRFANIIKLPNISASVPQLNAAIQELQAHGYDVPNYPAGGGDHESMTERERDIQARYKTVLGSAVNPVLREGNSDRRVAATVKEYAREHPHKMGTWSSDSRTHVSHMTHGDFYSSEKSTVMEKAGDIKIEFISQKDDDDGTTKTKVLREKLALQQGEVIDASVMNIAALRKFFQTQMDQAKEQGILLSLHLKCTMMKVSDPIMFGHCVKVYFKDVFDKHGTLFNELGVNPNNGLGDVYKKIATLPDQAKRTEIEADIQACYKHRPELAMVNSDKGITNLHCPSDIIIDASMAASIRDAGKMWDTRGNMQDTKAMIPDRSYATMYQEIIRFCQENGAFDPKTMGNVCNVGLMARKAEEYGSHDKTFEMTDSGIVRVTRLGDGGDDNTQKVLLEHTVEKGDIWRMCQTKDNAIQDWVKLAVKRARETGSPAIFWLDRERAHDATVIAKVETYLKDHNMAGLDIRIMHPVDAMRFTAKRAKDGEDTISVTGNVLRDYLTDLFPILELNTSAKMLSIVPLLAGGGLYETGAGGSAPKHVQQFVREGHLRWDSLGEFLALAVSLEDLGNNTDNARAKILAETLSEATGFYLHNAKAPSRKVNELDNRGGHFYLALYWARAVAAQNKDLDLKERFTSTAQQLEENESKIMEELAAAQGQAVDIGCYYHPDPVKATQAMRPSTTFNTILGTDKFIVTV